MTNQPKPISNSLLIIVFGAVVIVVILVIGALAIYAPGNTTVIATIIGFATLAIPSFLTLKISSESKAVSVENRHSIAASSAQQAQTSEEQKQTLHSVETKVDGHQSELMAEVRAGAAKMELMSQEITNLKEAAAKKTSTDEQATKNKNEIITALQTPPPSSVEVVS